MIRAFAIPALITFFALSSVFAAAAKPAGVVSLNKGTVGLALMSGRVTEVKHLVAKCGPTEECVNETRVKIEFGLGCTDDLAVTAKSSFNPRTGKVVIDVTALELQNEKSLVARCIVQNRKTATVVAKSTLPNVKASDVTVNFQNQFSVVNP